MTHDPLAERAYRELYPGKEPPRELRVTYSAKFKGFNARVLMTPRDITFSLSRKFVEASDELKVGVMQQLMNRLFKTKHETLEIQLYSKFIKNMTDYAATTRVDPYLQDRFEVINTRYFDGFMMVPNLAWGTYSLTKLGHYEYATDTIILSTALKEDEELLDYVLYHEMLHKKLKFDEKPGGFTRSHTKTFRTAERKFHVKDAEKRLERFVRERRRARKTKRVPPRSKPFRSLADFFRF